ncbi:tetratricopeptide repeat protein [Gilvimarinus polysaccharolyticus]|uniref:tetratricopeptide repeat protein n=1 Tax=Gilvimarinus polysaccharolyticus TaxID=863921 RepID=UPI0006734266|nr:sel1 repeat family protein [Gilvimarinus polysaccharolyticus]
MNRTLLFLIFFTLVSCSQDSDHERASKLLFGSSNPDDHSEGFSVLYKEYENGSAYSAGKIGWAYQKGLSVEANLSKALELYHFAARKGMTYWQYMLAHAYEMGYLGLEKSSEQRDYWLNYKSKVHIDIYECWVEYYYSKGFYPENPEMEKLYREKCKNS